MLTSGAKLGPYEIVGPLGAGGMGEVYRARDTRLERTVAIKVLPAHLTSSADSKQRFEREAKAISSLNHPHICTLHDVGSQDGIDFLVMEYLEGESLAERLLKGPLPVGQCIRIGIEIAEALGKAHRAGIVHRDLKPGNVMLTKSGAKLMDFGLAKPALAVGAATNRVTPDTPTMSVASLASPASPLTQKGTIVGTFQYMAPEVLQGAESDARSDIFSFGCVLYEMITGRRAFEGKSQISVLAAILEKEPEPLSLVQPLTPPALDRIIASCLAKDPEQRWQSVADIGRELRWSADAPPTAVQAASSQRRRRELSWIAACVVLLLMVIAGAWRAFQQPKLASMRLQIVPPEKTAFGYGLAVSPDGTQFCFSATSDAGESSLACRALNSPQIRVLAGTEGATFPFWAPDSATIAFFAGGKLKKIDLASGSLQVLADASDPRGGDWNRNGDIIYAPAPGTGLYRISSSGGDPTAITTLGGRDASHRWPHFLPDGKHFLYFLRTAEGLSEEKILLGTLGSQEHREFMTASSGVTAIPGYVLFLRGHTLFAQQLDERNLRLRGEPLVLADGVEPEGESGPTSYSPFTVSSKGVLIYLQASPMRNQLAWFDRTGKHLQDVGSVSQYDEPALSPDGTRLAIDRLGDGIWVLDLARETFTRFSLSTKNGQGAVWSPDGTQIVFGGTPPNGGGFVLYQKASSGAGPEELLPGTSGYPGSFSPDGRYLVYEALNGYQRSNASGLWVLPMFGDRKPYAYLTGASYNRTHAAFSRDGRWVAYTSEESGRAEIFVQSFPDPRTKIQISTEGGDQASWSTDGKELFYFAQNRSIVSVTVDTHGDFVAQKPQPLFTAPIRRSTGAGDSRTNYAVSPDGKRFLLNTVERLAPIPVTVVVNWTSELKK